jgi:response regulator RpfG family c-di-GMP phosphodiesterase
MNLKDVIPKIPENFSFLVVEDILVTRKKILRELKKLNLNSNILEASTIEEAQEILEKEKIDFIIADLELNDGTGLDFLLHIKNCNKSNSIPFIICTTIDKFEEVLLSIQYGAEDFLIRPCRKEDLEHKVLFNLHKIL